MPKNICKYLTIEDLLNFCKQSNMGKFSASEAGGPIIIQSFGEVSTSDTTTSGLTPCTLMACHTELNINKSYIADDVAEKALASFSNRPILGYIHQLDDGNWDFWDHHMELQEDENGECRVEYLESPIGVIPESCNAHIEYDEDNKKNYVVVNGYLYDDYGNRAIDIIKANNGKVSVSVELAINEMSFNVKDNCLNIEDFTFMAVTCLGKEPDGTSVKPGMEGSNLKLDNFSQKQNSVFANQDTTNLIKVLEKLNTTLKNFDNKKSTEKEDERMTKFDELLAKYAKTKDDVTFEVEGLSDEELEAKFEEVFGCKKKKCSKEHFDELVAKYNTTAEDCGIAYEDVDEEDVDAAFKAKFEDDGADASGEGESAGDDTPETEPTTPATDDDDDNEPDPVPVDDTPSKKKPKGYALTYELSHDDIRSGLYALYAATGNYDVWIPEVYDAYFVVQNYRDCKYYRQGYTKTTDSVAFNGEPIEIFAEWLTQVEKDALASLRADYAVLKDFKAKYDAAELKAAKDDVFADTNYECIVNEDAFKALKADAEKFSVEDIRTKCDLIFAAHIKSVGTFVKTGDEPQAKPHKVGFNFAAEPDEEYAPYGNILPPKKKTK